MPTKRATIYEVADHAGVSHQTVSRYLRHNGGLKPATLARVEAAIAELNYRPNRIARSMRTRRTGRLAILLPGAIQFLPAAAADRRRGRRPRGRVRGGPGRPGGRRRRPGRRGPTS